MGWGSQRSCRRAFRVRRGLEIDDVTLLRAIAPPRAPLLLVQLTIGAESVPLAMEGGRLRIDTHRPGRYACSTLPLSRLA